MAREEHDLDMNFDFRTKHQREVERLQKINADLLAALKGMLENYEGDHGEGVCDCDDSVGLPLCNACKARALIDKAEKHSKEDGT